jgi:hypothetical protein
MDNSETLTTLGTQETGWTMIDIALHRKFHNNPDDNASDTKEKTVLAQLAVPVMSIILNIYTHSHKKSHMPIRQ